MSEASQEMSLDQWVERLHPNHRARRELAELRARLLTPCELETHTPGPWGVSIKNGAVISIIAINGSDHEPGGVPVIVRKHGIAMPSSPRGRANAQRIVDCVNACEGINPEAIPNMLEALRFYADKESYKIEIIGWGESSSPVESDKGERAANSINQATNNQ